MARTVSMAAAAMELLSPASAFVAPSGAAVSASASSQPVPHAQRASAASDASSKSLSAAALLSIAGVAAVSATKKVRRSTVARNLNAGVGGFDVIPADEDPYKEYRRELPFAGGLIGGASAFSSGDYNFDPLNLSERFFYELPYYREAELKHGRICMLAWIGLVVPDFVRIPVDKDIASALTPCYEAANVVDAHNMCVALNLTQEQVQQGPTGVWGLNGGPLFQIFLFTGIVELCTTYPKIWTGSLTLQNAGNYSLGLNFLPDDPDKAKEMKLKELKNGRLAMLAFGGAITQAVLTGNGFPWLYAEKEHRGVGLTSSTPAARSTASRMTRHADVFGKTGEYKMSKAVPFLPMSPALEGWAGEEEGFDPLGISLAFDIRWLREAELKHARVSMLAVVGWITVDMGVRVPGAPFQVSTIEAHDAMVKFGSMPQILVWMGFLELFGFLAIVNMYEMTVLRMPGDFGLRVGYPEDIIGQRDMQLRELRNGRLAMLAYGGIVTAAVLTGKTWPFFATSDEQQKSDFASGSALCGGLQSGKRAGATATSAWPKSNTAYPKPADQEERYGERTDADGNLGPFRPSASLPFLPAPQNLQGYVGCEQEFDPLGFTDVWDISWMREAELKHGRVAMLATVGFFTQQWATFPGFSPTPNALDSLYTAPPGATGALLFLAGYIESTSYGGKITMLDMFADPDGLVRADSEIRTFGSRREPGDFNFGKGYLKGKSEEEIYDLKLKELNNGRLAMFALGGMVHHNLVVSGPLFPLFPEGWQGPQGTWNYGSFIGDIVNGKIGNEVVPDGAVSRLL